MRSEAIEENIILATVWDDVIFIFKHDNGDEQGWWTQ